MTIHDYEEMDDQELRDTHERLLRIQRGELGADRQGRALDVAKERQALWEEADERGVDL